MILAAVIVIFLCIVMTVSGVSVLKYFRSAYFVALIKYAEHASDKNKDRSKNAKQDLWMMRVIGWFLISSSIVLIGGLLSVFQS